MTVSALKVQFRKLTPTVISYRDYKILSNVHFIDTLRSNKTEGKVSYDGNVMMGRFCL